MSFNSEPIVQQVQTDFHNLLAYVTGPQARTQPAYTVELTLVRLCWRWARPWYASSF